MLFERRVGDKDLHFVLSALRAKDVKDVKEIDLRSNRIGDEGATMLSEFLEWSGRVEILRLNSNDIGAQGAIRLAKTLGTNTSLKVLVLNDNKIGKKGSLSIAKAFRTNSTLEVLDLGNTDLDTGADELMMTTRVWQFWFRFKTRKEHKSFFLNFGERERRERERERERERDVHDE